MSMQECCSAGKVLSSWGAQSTTPGRGAAVARIVPKRKVDHWHGGACMSPRGVDGAPVSWLVFGFCACCCPLPACIMPVFCVCRLDVLCKQILCAGKPSATFEQPGVLSELYRPLLPRHSSTETN